MINFKIKKIKKIAEAKEVFSFISASNKSDAISHSLPFLPLHSIYNTILSNTSSKTSLQFYAKNHKSIIGAMISSPHPHDTKTLALQVFSVQTNYRNNGFASIMLCETLKLASNQNYKNVRVEYNAFSSGFFSNKDFKLYLEILIPSSIEFTIEQIAKMNLTLVNILSFNSLNIAKFEVPCANRQLLNEIKHISPLLKAKYFFEKTL